MRINLWALTVTLGLLWGTAILVTASANVLWPGYGQPFLDVVASVYPGYHAGRSVGQVILGTLYGLADGSLTALILGSVYNALSARHTTAA